MNGRYVCPLWEQFLKNACQNYHCLCISGESELPWLSSREVSVISLYLHQVLDSLIFSERPTRILTGHLWER